MNYRAKVNNVLANYKDEDQELGKLLEPKCEKPIVILRGKEGYGKSAVIRRLMKRIKDTTRHIYIDLDDETIINATSIFTRFEVDLFSDLSSLERHRQSSIIVKNVQLYKNNNLTINVQDWDARKEYVAGFSTALLNDIIALNQITLIIFDSYERSLKNIQDWLRGTFLSGVIKTENVRILIAVRESTNGSDIKLDEDHPVWGEHCTTIYLNGIHKAEDWDEVLKEYNICFSGGYTWQGLIALCSYFEGNPTSIKAYIEALRYRGASL